VRVWVTRSQPGADRQAADLRAAGHEAIVAPVLRAVATIGTPPKGPFDLLIFLSEHAVRFGLPALQRAPWLSTARILAVGARTAAVLGEAGIEASAPDGPATSEGLLDSSLLDGIDGRRVLLVRGIGGRSVLAGELRRRGAAVFGYACYRREPLSGVDAAVRGCDVIVVSSGDGLREVDRLWRAAGGAAAVPLLVPSARVARLGVELGFSNIHDCGGADSSAVLAVLRRLACAGTS
jgi:uroporphyrinogen-III synthase